MRCIMHNDIYHSGNLTTEQINVLRFVSSVGRHLAETPRSIDDLHSSREPRETERDVLGGKQPRADGVETTDAGMGCGKTRGERPHAGCLRH